LAVLFLWKGVGFTSPKRLPDSWGGSAHLCPCAPLDRASTFPECATGLLLFFKQPYEITQKTAAFRLSVSYIVTGLFFFCPHAEICSQQGRRRS